MLCNVKDHDFFFLFQIHIEENDEFNIFQVIILRYLKPNCCYLMKYKEKHLGRRKGKKYQILLQAFRKRIKLKYTIAYKKSCFQQKKINNNKKRYNFFSVFERERGY